MRWSGGVNRACRVAGVIAFALLISACARSQPKEYGIGSTGGVASPGSPQEFAANVGDLVHFQDDSTALTGEAQGSCATKPAGLTNIPNTRSPSRVTPMSAAHASITSRLAPGGRWRSGRSSPAGGESRRASAPSPTARSGRLRCATPTCWSQNRRAQTVLNNGAVARVLGPR